MNHQKTTYSAPALIFLMLLLTACGSNKFLSGRKHFNNGEYFLAAEEFRDVYSKLKNKNEKAEAAYMLGTSYKKLGEYNKSIPWLKNALRYQYPEKELPLKLAEANKASGKLEESTSLLQEYLKNNPGHIASQNSLEANKKYPEWEKVPTLCKVERDSRLSSPWNEHAISFIESEKQVAISSSKEGATGKKNSPVDGQTFADIYFSDFNKELQRWELPTEPKDANLNSNEHESYINFSPDGTKLIMVRSGYSENGPGKSHLYVSEKNNEEWSPLLLVPFCLDGADYPQASWACNGKEIFFASNRNGGLGGFDIWKTKWMENNQFEEPVNLGTPINTPGNEIYPFERHSGTLYFSSDFHPGAGAQDIFKASNLGGKWKVKNMELPINSYADDLGIVFAKEGESGFLLSNRKGSRGLDIYRFSLPPHLFMCFGKVFNDETDSIIPNVNIRVLGTDGSVAKLVTNNGKFQLELLPDNEYTLIAYKKGFLNAQAKISTIGLNNAKEFKLDFKQKPTDNPIRLENIFYETGKWELLPTSQKSLDELIGILNINPDINIEISAHTDEVGADNFNLELSQKRANEVVNYLKQKGIASSRLQAKGYGEKKPYIANTKLARKMKFLQSGVSLSSTYVSTLNTEQQEIAKSLNRRTEFEVINH
ncbi:OmpA family protein [Sunxiuqinia sp. A32]|uniref:OmpA family protein n=1 Tax=Sunxiuqinia sp. A32 TaxID=3461496 RepID=UPI00404551A0